MSDTPRTLESLQQAAARYGVHPQTIRRAISRGNLHGYTLGARIVRVDPDEVDRLFRPIPSVLTIAEGTDTRRAA